MGDTFSQVEKKIGGRITLHPRTAETVATYFSKAQHPAIRRTLPQKAKTLDEALTDFAMTQLPGATSYGRTIQVDGCYVGDVWCYAIDAKDTPSAMLSYCVFEQERWGNGVATEAVRLFLTEVREKFALHTVGAFTYTENLASVRVLEKNGFKLIEEFVEDNVSSQYYELTYIDICAEVL